MTLNQILTGYQNNTLANETDLRLSDAQETLSNIIRVMKAADQIDFWSAYQPLTIVSTCQLIAIRSLITRTLSARYRCNN